jgi:hypothetical protein
MKNVILILLVVVGVSSCKKSYQCTISDTDNPFGTGMTTKKFWSSKEMQQWVDANTHDDQVAECH